MGVFESRPIARDAVARCLRPLHPRSIRSRRSQGRRPYEPSVRRDATSVAHRWTGSGRTVRETVGVLKGLGNFRPAIMAEGIGSAFIPPSGEGNREAVEGARTVDPRKPWPTTALPPPPCCAWSPSP